MSVFKFILEHPLKYVFTGKFEAPSPEWKHDYMELIDYELFVVTKGPLYISYQGENWGVSAVAAWGADEGYAQRLSLF